MKNQNESLDESDFEYMQAERDVWKARYEFACADRKKLLSDNAGLVRNQESNTAAFLAMREERDALKYAAKLAFDTLRRINAVDDDCNILSSYLEDSVIESIESLKKVGVK